MFNGRRQGNGILYENERKVTITGRNRSRNGSVELVTKGEGKNKPRRDDGDFRAGVLPSFIRDTNYSRIPSWLLRVIYLYGPRAEGKYTYREAMGRG